MAGFDPDAYLATQPEFDPDAYLASAKPVSEIPAPRGFLTSIGHTYAAGADTLLGIIPQTIAETGYAGVRAMEGMGLAKPGQAQRGKEAFLNQFGKPVGAAFGVTETPDYQNEASQRLTNFIGQYANKGADWISKQTGVPKADVENLMFFGSFAVPAVGGKIVNTAKAGVDAAAPFVKQAAGKVAETPAAQAIIKPLQERKARIQEENVTRSFDNAAQIDAANLAAKNGIALNPAVSNPTKSNRIKSTIAGVKNLDESLSKINEVKITNLVKEDMGLPANTELNAKAFDKALSQQSAPYDKVRGIPQLAPDQGVLSQIEGLRIDRPAIGGEASAAAVNGLVDEALAKVAQGRSGAEIITDIRKLRKDANGVYTAQQKSGVPDPTLIAKADASIGVANALENLIEANVTDPKLLGELRAARAKMAQIYDYERATNIATGRVDAQVLAKMVEDGKPLSGVAAEIGKIAAVFPDVVQSGKPGAPMFGPERLTRSGAAGTLGFAIGSTFGMPILGGIAGAAGGNVLGNVVGRRIASPAYQIKNAVPQDFRPPVNNLRPAPPSNTANLPVPYDYRNSLLTPDQVPNWVYGRNAPEGNVQMGVPNTPALETPGGQSGMSFVDAQRTYEYNRARAEAEAANTAQASREAAGRTPTKEGTLFELDPITGKLRNVSQGLKGATLDVIQNTGNALNSAAEKVAAGQRFAMSAAEKVAWDKTKVDLKVIDPEFAKLSDKAIAAKSMDRAWVESALVKAREQAAAFADIAKRSNDAQQVRRAKAEREKLMDAMEGLETMLNKPRAVSSGAQGPKTRQAIVNNMIENRNIKNNLGND